MLPRPSNLACLLLYGRLETAEPPLADALEHLFALLGVMPHVGLVMRKRDGERFIDAIHEVNLHALLLLWSQILFDVLPVFRRQDYMSDAGSLGGQELLLDPTYR